MSNMTVSISPSARMKGSASSTLAPMPLNRSSAGRSLAPAFTATLRSCPRARIIWTFIAYSLRNSVTAVPGRTAIAIRRRSRVEDICAGRGLLGGELRGAQFRRRRRLFARPLGEPRAPVDPPAAVALLGGARERFGFSDAGSSQGVSSLRITGRIEKALQVASVRQDER